MNNGRKEVHAESYMYTVITFNLDSPKRKISHFLMYMYEYTSPFNILQDHL